MLVRELGVRSSKLSLRVLLNKFQIANALAYIKQPRPSQLNRWENLFMAKRKELCGAPLLSLPVERKESCLQNKYILALIMKLLKTNST